MELRVLLVLAVLAVAVAAGLAWRSREGRYVAVTAEARLTAQDVGVDLGSTATFVQLSAEVCAPCRRTAAALGALAGELPGLVHVELPVEQRMDLVRRFDVLRTPTVLVLDAAGTVRGRLSGGTTRAQALAALERCPGAVAAG
jgi:thiol-disulfide isomerase/thioredoxin